MCLPSIIEIAEKAGIELNPRSLNKKEVFGKCPFCLGDAHIKGKYKLSLNQQDNVFKCWLCGVRGGVLEFESKLSGVPYDEVKTKYFGKKKKYHPAEMLSPSQLKTIGWSEFKRRNREDFMKKREEVLQDWKEYERSEKVKFFAMLMVIAHLDKQEERQQELLIYLAKACGESGVKMLFSTIMDEYIKESDERSEWTVEAIEIARRAWKISLETFDFDFDNVLSNTVMCFYMSKFYNQNVLNDDLNQKTS